MGHVSIMELACEQAPGEEGKKISARAKQKNSESKAIGAGIFVRAHREPVRRL